jgi:hypothetical protein
MVVAVLTVCNLIDRSNPLPLSEALSRSQGMGNCGRGGGGMESTLQSELLVIC